MAYDGTDWNEGDPSDSTVANTIDDHMQHIKKGVRSRMAREHVWPASQAATNEAGHHNFITLQMQTGAPTLAGTTAGALYIGSSASGYPLMFENSAGASVIIVNSGAARVSAVTGGTQGSIPICSSASPSTLTVLAASATGYALITMSATAPPMWGDHGSLAGRDDADHAAYIAGSTAGMAFACGATTILSGSGEVSFGITFADTLYMPFVMASSNASFDAMLAVQSVSVATMVIRNGNGGNVPIRWAVIGRT